MPRRKKPNHEKQATLFGEAAAAAAPARRVIRPSKLTMQRRFEEFHARHPEVMRECVERTFEIAAKKRHGGFRMVWERVRWSMWVEKEEGEQFMLNNNLHSRYARKIMEDYPSLRGFFELRKLRSK
jgi:hypothetical protein